MPYLRSRKTFRDSVVNAHIRNQCITLLSFYILVQKCDSMGCIIDTCPPDYASTSNDVVLATETA